jgi:hypothetical protein
MVVAGLSEICRHIDDNIELVTQRAIVQNEEGLRILNTKRPECWRRRNSRGAGVNGVGSMSQRLAFSEPLRVVDAVKV